MNDTQQQSSDDLGATIQNWTRVGVAIILIGMLGLPLAVGQTAQSKGSIQSGELVPIQRNGKWGYADKAGNIRIKAQFSRADPFSDGLALVWTGGVHLDDPVVTSFVKMGYIDLKGQWVIHSRYKYFFYDDFSEGLVPFRQQSDKWGYMNKTGTIVIPTQFGWAGSFSNGLAPVLLENKCAHVDKSGRITDQSQSVLPQRKHEQDRHGTFTAKPSTPPCS